MSYVIVGLKIFSFVLTLTEKQGPLITQCIFFIDLGFKAPSPIYLHVTDNFNISTHSCCVRLFAWTDIHTFARRDVEYKNVSGLVGQIFYAWDWYWLLVSQDKGVWQTVLSESNIVSAGSTLHRHKKAYNFCLEREEVDEACNNLRPLFESISGSLSTPNFKAQFIEVLWIFNRWITVRNMESFNSSQLAPVEKFCLICRISKTWIILHLLDEKPANIREPLCLPNTVSYTLIQFIIATGLSATTTEYSEAKWANISK